LYLRVRSLPGVNPKPPFSPILDPTVMPSNSIAQAAKILGRAHQAHLGEAGYHGVHRVNPGCVPSRHTLEALVDSSLLGLLRALGRFCGLLTLRALVDSLLLWQCNKIKPMVPPLSSG